MRQLLGDDYTIISSYNMYLMKGGSTRCTAPGQVEIGMPIPAAYENAAVTIVYIDNNDKITQTGDPQTGWHGLCDRPDHFSNYALVGLEEAASDGWTVSYLLILEAAAAVACDRARTWLLYFKKMEKDEKGQVKTTRTSNEHCPKV